MRLIAALFLIGLAAAARAEVPRVVTDIAPVHGLAAAIMEGIGTPSLILPAGTTPHDHALRPSQARALQQADLVVWVGPALTPWLARTVETLSGDAQVISLLDLPETHQLDARDIAAFDEHENVDSHDDEAKTIDPHAWLSPDNARAWSALITAALSTQDPDNADGYKANDAAARQAIDAAEAAARARLEPLQERGYLVFHDAYQYFEDHFGLRPTTAVALSDAAAPGPARVRELQALSRAGELACIFAEPQFESGLIDTLVEGTNARKALLDPLGAELSPGPEFYPKLLTNLSEAVADCLKG